MKGLVLGSVALIAISVSIPAHAADMAVKAPPPTVSVAPYNWSGLYVGGYFGGAWTSRNLNIPGNNFYGGLTEFIGGDQAGYNSQAGNFLYGVEGDFDWATIDHPTLPTHHAGRGLHSSAFWLWRDLRVPCAYFDADISKLLTLAPQAMRNLT
jgi:opacity protein-like surface antigen